jgi:hypothetical protein
VNCIETLLFDCALDHRSSIKSYRQSVSPNCIHLDLKYIHLLFHFHDMFRFQKIFSVNKGGYIKLRTVTVTAMEPWLAL